MLRKLRGVATSRSELEGAAFNRYIVFVHYWLALIYWKVLLGESLLRRLLALSAYNGHEYLLLA